MTHDSKSTSHRRRTTWNLLIAFALSAALLLCTGAECDDASVETTAAQAAARTHYFDGRFLTADDLTQEQDYHRDH